MRSRLGLPKNNRRAGGQETRSLVFSYVEAPDLLMSSRSDKTPSGRVARLTPGGHTADKPGHSSASVVVHPEQLSGPRARTRIRPGVTTPRSAVMEPVSV